MAVFLGAWAASSALYVLFAGQFSPDELAAAVLVGLGASLWSAVMRRRARVRFGWEQAAAAAAARALASLPAAGLRVALRLLAALIGGRGGETGAQPFAHGRREDPADATRRAVAVLACSLAPDAFVVRAPEGQDELVLHRLARSSSGGDVRWGL